MKKKHCFTCIVCPVGCQIELMEGDEKTLQIAGMECELGEKYVRKEFTNPERILTTTVRVKGGILSMLPVRTEKPIPKQLMKSCMKKLAETVVKAPVECGEIVYPNIWDTGINVIATRKLPAKESEATSKESLAL